MNVTHLLSRDLRPGVGRGGDDGGGRYFASSFRDTCHFTTEGERGIIIVVC
jgi:hypothetical protein